MIHPIQLNHLPDHRYNLVSTNIQSRIIYLPGQNIVQQDPQSRHQDADPCPSPQTPVVVDEQSSAEGVEGDRAAKKQQRVRIERCPGVN